MEKEEFKKLVDKYLQNRATPEEKDLLFRYYEGLQEPDAVWDDSLMGERGEVHQQMYSRILKNIDGGRNRGNSTRWWSMAAAIIVLFAVGLLVYRNAGPNSQVVVAGGLSDVLPGGNKAVLTLSDGSKIILDDDVKGIIAHQSGMTVTKAKNGLLIYKFTNSESPESGVQPEVAYNTITTPNGGQYQVMLPDGTNVWLNAASSLTFPTQFGSSDRKVELSGEAYFDVSKQMKEGRKLPFVVKINTTSGNAGEVEVLGTHFNIMAYDNEKNVNTTLFEGAVRVKKGGQERLLKPGQQAQSARAEKAPLYIIDGVDADEILAWKNGQFRFSNVDIETILRQIARWYDVDVVIEGELPDEGFNGKMSRNENLSQVVKVLKLNGLNLKIEGRKLIVKP